MAHTDHDADIQRTKRGLAWAAAHNESPCPHCGNVGAWDVITPVGNQTTTIRCQACRNPVLVLPPGPDRPVSAA